jgi:hypothetical protein
MTGVSATGLGSTSLGNGVQSWLDNIGELVSKATKRDLLTASHGTATVGKSGVTVRCATDMVLWKGNDSRPPAIKVENITIQKAGNVITNPYAITGCDDLKNRNYVPGNSGGFPGGSDGVPGVNEQRNFKDGDVYHQNNYFYPLSECDVVFDADTVVVTLPKPSGKSIVYEKGTQGYDIIAKYAQDKFAAATA